MAEQGPEPNGWELMRGLERVEKALGELGGKVVPTDVYVADKQAASERVARAETRLRDLETNAVESEKLKRQQRLTISLAIASPFIVLLVSWIAQGGLTP